MQAQKVFFPNLKATRILRGHTLKDMRLLLEYKSESRYAMYETGDRKPNVIEALRIATVLGATVEYLFATEAKQNADEGVTI